MVVAVQGGFIASPAVIRQEVDAYPLYNYGYSVQDHLSGDIKTQEESRDGDVVRGIFEHSSSKFMGFFNTSII
jgi:hypothetical protein